MDKKVNWIAVIIWAILGLILGGAGGAVIGIILYFAFSFVIIPILEWFISLYK